MELRTLARRLYGAGIVVVGLALGACGGGGGGGSPQSPPTPSPTVTFTISPASVDEGQSVQLTWSSTGATSCSASGGWIGSVATSGTQSVGPLTVSTTFTLSCSGAGGTTNADRPVTVNPAPAELALTATPRIVRDGQTSQLTWTGKKITTCEASGGWSGPRPASGSETVGPFASHIQFAFQLTCTSVGGVSVPALAVVESRAGTNQAPTADAGPDKMAISTQRVDLQATQSTDDHGLVSSSWTQTAGPAVTLGPGFTQLDASFTAPIVQADTVLTFALTLTDDEGLASAPDTVDITIQPIPPIVTITGDVNYERVPHGFPGTGLSYAGQGLVSTAAVFLEVLDASTQNVLASGSFPGEFHFDVPRQTDVRLRATATLSRQAPAPLPHWQISVRDLDASGAPLGDVYSYTGPVFNSGAGGRHTLDIPSGWNTAGQLVGPRHAAPFAILDSIRIALDDLVSLVPRPDLPPLIVDWSPSNQGGETFFAGGFAPRIVLAGEADVDTDEYDESVILHEFGHFIMDSVSRSDSLGGPHTLGERVDMRVALSEGFATAYGALTAGNTAYLDSFGVGQHNSGFFDVDFDSQLNEGWYSESSVHELLFDLGNLDGLWIVLNGPLRDSDAMVSPFALFTALRQINAGGPGTLDALLQQEGIVGPTIDPYGSTEVNDAGSADVLPVYTPIAIGGSVQVRSTNQFGVGNKLSTHRFLRLNVPVATDLRFRVSAAVGRDPDVLVFHRGEVLGTDNGPADEDFSLVLQPGDYVLDVYDCGNADCNSNVTPGPVDITVAITAN